MFWNKKKKKDLTKCNTDKGLSECQSVANLRKYQQELEQVERLDLDKIIERYLLENTPFYDTYSTVYNIKYTIIHTLNNSQENFADRFKKFGAEIDSYLQREQLIKNLNTKIYLEKEKLGIK